VGGVSGGGSASGRRQRALAGVRRRGSAPDRGDRPFAGVGGVGGGGSASGGRQRALACVRRVGTASDRREGPLAGVRGVGGRCRSASDGWERAFAGVGDVGRRGSSRWKGSFAGLRGRPRPGGACALRVVRGGGAAGARPARGLAVVARADRLVVDVGRRAVGLGRARARPWRPTLRRPTPLRHRSAAARGLDPADGPSGGRRARRAPGVAAAGWAGWRAERALGSAVAVVHRPHPPPPRRRVAARGARSRDGLIDEDDTNGPRVRRSGTDRPVPVHLGDHADALGTGMIAASRAQRRSPPP
jgi:hypothetical protein